MPLFVKDSTTKILHFPKVNQCSMSVHLLVLRKFRKLSMLPLNIIYFGKYLLSKHVFGIISQQKQHAFTKCHIEAYKAFISTK